MRNYKKNSIPKLKYDSGSIILGLQIGIQIEPVLTQKPSGIW